MYSDDAAAALYEVLNPWDASDDFYVGLVMETGSVLDVGRGTGAILRRAREAGHRGRLRGELAIMTGHAFQVLIDDGELRASLVAISRSLTDGGRFAFETRNPLARAWKTWNPGNPIDVVDPSGTPLRVWYQVESVAGDVVTLSETTADQNASFSSWVR